MKIINSEKYNEKFYHFNKKELMKEVRNIFSYYSNINLLKKKELLHLINNSCINISLKYFNNSCYIDSLIISLFNQENLNIYNIIFNSIISPIFNNYKILINNINDIKYELHEIYLIIHNKKNISTGLNYYTTVKFRKLLDIYQNNYIKYINPKKEKINWLYDQSEPFIIINELHNMLLIEKSIQINYIKWASNSLSKNIPKKKNLLEISNISIENDFVISIGIDNLINNDDIYIKNIIPINISDTKFTNEENYWLIKNKKYSRKIEKRIILSAKFILLHIERLSNFKLNTKIIPKLKIKLKKNKFPLYLNSIIVHIGNEYNGHYICIYNCKGFFYIYDDMKTNINKIGNFDEMCKYKDGLILKNCTDILYS